MIEKIGKYEIAEQIGVGGFGAVYRGRDPFIKRTVAVKTCQVNDEEIKSRFFREAELAGNLHHRNITTIFDFGVENGIPYIVQEFLSGEDLDKQIKRGEPMAAHRKVEILLAIAEGLEYAHNASIIHRDIKPANIRLLENGSVKIMDFGIAKSLEAVTNLTQTGITLGTSAYLAPEQIRGEPVDRRTDIFALGILGYELLTYRKPFRGEHLSTVLYKILNETPEPILQIASDVPPALAAIVDRAMEKDRDKRYPSMEDLRRDLETVYREITGRSARLPVSPPTVDPDATLRTPSRGMDTTSGITPPSGALARVPAAAAPPPAPPPRPTATARRTTGLELVNPHTGEEAGDQTHVGPAPPRIVPPAAGDPRRRFPVWIVAAGALAVAIGAFLVLSRNRETARPEEP
ncbi:MAG: serine/threonine-protein kinase, partial [Thermoanaerobaculia bacterium]